MLYIGNIHNNFIAEKPKQAKKKKKRPKNKNKLTNKKQTKNTDKYQGG